MKRSNEIGRISFIAAGLIIWHITMDMFCIKLSSYEYHKEKNALKMPVLFNSMAMPQVEAALYPFL